MIPLNDATIERESRWLRTEGQTFTANLLEALWRDVRDRAGGCSLMMDVDTERMTLIRVAALSEE